MALRILPWGLLVFLLSFAFAQGDLEKVEKDLLNFVAPKVADINNVPGAEAGLIVYDTSHDEFKAKKNSGAFVTLGVPTGAILPFMGTTPPMGFLLCDGSAVSRTQYANLFAVIGTSSGFGNGSTTFNLPDFRGMFLRGVSGSSGNDPQSSSRTTCKPGGNSQGQVGSCQDEDYKSHFHYGVIRKGSHPAGQLVATSTTAGRNTWDATGDNIDQRTDNIGGLETRPKNVYVNYIIKL